MNGKTAFERDNSQNIVIVGGLRRVHAHKTWPRRLLKCDHTHRCKQLHNIEWRFDIIARVVLLQTWVNWANSHERSQKGRCNSWLQRGKHRRGENTLWPTNRCVMIGPKTQNDVSAVLHTSDACQPPRWRQDKRFCHPSASVERAIRVT